MARTKKPKTQRYQAVYSTDVASAGTPVRMAFLRKVYGILTAQLILTTLVAGWFMSSEPIKQYVQQHIGLLFSSFLGAIVSLLALMWFRTAAPINYILLAIFTLCESYSVGVFVTLFTIPSVIEALLITTALFVSLTMYTLQSETDFSSWHAPAFMCLCTLLIAQLIQIFFPVPAMHLVLSIVGAVLFCVFVVIDTHLIMEELSPDEYIMGAVSLYLDIVNIFINILAIFGQRK